MSYVLFDIGGTKTRVAVSDDLKTFSEPIKFTTPPTAKAGVKEIVAAVKQLTDKDIRGIAGGIRGSLAEDKSMMIHDAGGALTGWQEEPIVAMLKKELGAPVTLENDAALAGLGEAVFGAGEGDNIVVYMTVSTGVGGAKIESGQIDDYHYGFEPGHQILDVDRTVLGEGEDPTLENLVSGSAVERHYGMKPYEIPQSDALWGQLAEYLADGLRNTILYWSPDVIVLGGSMIIGDPRIILEDIERETAKVLEDIAPMPAIVDARLGDSAGLYGAMVLLDQQA